MKSLLGVLLLLSSSSLAQMPVIRARFEPANKITVGQPVRLIVSVFVPNYFTGAPEFPEFEIENAIVVQPQDRPEHSNTQIAGTSYAGITQTYVVYPQQAGDFAVPPAKISVPYAVTPPKTSTAQVSLPQLSFHADLPAAARDLPYFLPTTQLTIHEHWSRPLKDLRAGDTVVRTITVTASKMQAMLIPPLEFEGPDGVRVYESEPIVRNQKTSRGDFVSGQRVQTAKYFIEKPGYYTLPQIELKWWNLSTRRMMTATLPPTRFTAVTNPDYKPELPPPLLVPTQSPITQNPRPRVRETGHRAAQISLILALAILIGKLSRQLRLRVATTMAAHKNSEAGRFKRLIHTAKNNDAKATYSNLLQWASRAFPQTSLDEVIARNLDASLREEMTSLTRVLFGNSVGNSSWTGEKLVSCLRCLRRAQRGQATKGSAGSRLSMLNPLKAGEREGRG